MADNDLIAQFVFTLAQASTRTVTLSWETRDGTAVENIDYVPASGQLIFAPGETSKTVNIQVLQPPTEERKFFTVAITDAVNATVDETEPGQIVIMPNNVFRGKRGFKGDRGKTGMSAYEEAVANGSFTGSYADWITFLRAADADRITFFQAGSAALKRNLQERLRERVSVKDFGAIGDGTVHIVQEWIVPGALGWAASLAEVQAKFPHVQSVNDYIDRIAFQAGINFVLTTNPVKALEGPAGNYLFDKKLDAIESIAFVGHGIEQTMLTWDGTSVSQGFDIKYTSTRSNAHPLFRDVKFVRKGAYGGDAITVSGATGGGSPDIWRATFSNVRFSRGDRNTGIGSWARGIHTNSVAGFILDTVTFQGDVHPTSGGYYGRMLEVDGADGIPEVNSHGFVNNTFCTTAEYPVKASNCEDLYVFNFRYYNVDYGGWYDNEGNYDLNVVSPRVKMFSGHIKARKKGIYFKKAQASVIKDIYFLHDGTNTDPDYKHVQLDGCLNTVVDDNQIEGINGSTATGIELVNGSFDNVIGNNTFFSSGGDAIHLDSTSQSNYIKPNNFRSGGWARYVNNESLYVMRDRGIFSLKVDANVAFPNGSLVVPFSSIYRNELGTGLVDLVAAPTQINIRKRGKYILSAHAQITAHASGIRTANIRVNGGSPIGVGRITTAAAPTGATHLSVKSDPIILNANDKITLYLEQTSGTALEVVLNTVLTVEFVETA